ncbi:hypothetical protein B2J93_7779 [Marssonina coronariae]|uniref:Uncharacterized protein n=1 Tax=Diplocarpon coronariae TaxID=2795749 RepID=A0A218ZI88_9HELO|nr:hypothetical protein B2J93_7779 [Marssonina coronariae]
MSPTAGIPTASSDGRFLGAVQYQSDLPRRHLRCMSRKICTLGHGRNCIAEFSRGPEWSNFLPAQLIDDRLASASPRGLLFNLVLPIAKVCHDLGGVGDDAIPYETIPYETRRNNLHRWRGEDLTGAAASQPAPEPPTLPPPVYGLVHVFSVGDLGTGRGQFSVIMGPSSHPGSLMHIAAIAQLPS